MARITVIMGVYNDEKTLRRAIDSIINQTFSSWVFIICNDGSQDSSLDILNEYKSKYSDKFTIITNEENRGLTYSLNRCIKLVHTEYIARMDADDISMPSRFEQQISFLDNNANYDFVGSIANRFDEDGIWSITSLKEKPQNLDFLKSSSFVHPSIMIRSSALEVVNLYSDKWYTKRCEDYDLWMRLYAKGKRGYNIQTPLLNYYEGRSSFIKRKYRFRFCESITRLVGYYHLDLLPIGFLFALRPLVVGLLPSWVIVWKHKQ